MSTKRLALIAALTFSTSLWATRPALAGSVSGTWTGEVSTTTYYLLDGALVGSSSSNDLGQMTLTYDPSQYVVWMTIGGNEIAGMPVTDPYGTDALGPNGGSATVYGSIYPGPNYYGLPVGNYIVSYPSLLPDGSSIRPRALPTATSMRSMPTIVGRARSSISVSRPSPSPPRSCWARRQFLSSESCP